MMTSIGSVSTLMVKMGVSYPQQWSRKQSCIGGRRSIGRGGPKQNYI